MSWLRTHAEETIGSVFAIVTAWALTEVVLFAALSAFVGAFVGFLTKRFMEWFWPIVKHTVTRIFSKSSNQQE